MIARTRDEDADWTSNEIPDSNNSLAIAVYTVDDPQTDFAVPTNKGHEAMVYLTYIIDHYDSLDDVTLFMHSHQLAWHNNDLLGADAANMVWRLRMDKIIRDGYMVRMSLVAKLTGQSDILCLEPSVPSRAWMYSN